MASLKKVIKALECCSSDCWDCPYNSDCYQDGLTPQAIGDALELLKEKQWTPIAKKKPPYDKYVLLYTKTGNQIVGHRENHWGQDVYCDGRFGTGEIIFPTHWRKLPRKPTRNVKK